MYQHLFVPIDGSELSERAAVQSIGLAAKLGASITAFVVEPPAPLPNEASNISSYQHATDAHHERTDAHARKALDRFAALAAAQGVTFQGEFRRTAAVDDAIVEAAIELGCDLIVMVTHGRGALGELLFGSHTKNVLSRSGLPVLVLR